MRALVVALSRQSTHVQRRTYSSHMNKDTKPRSSNNGSSAHRAAGQQSASQQAPRPAQKGAASTLKEPQDTSLATIDETGREKRLEWQNESDRYDVPMEMRAVYKQLDNERLELEERVKEIVKLPDFSFYWHTLQNRIKQVELKYTESGRAFSSTLRQECDKEIEHVVYSTQEEFAAYYKARDEKMFALIERRLDALQRGKFDPETVRLLLDAETNFNQAQAQEVAMLAAGLPKYEPKDDDEFSNEEIDEDDIMDEPEAPEIKRLPELKNDPFYNFVKKVEKEKAKPAPAPKRFIFKGEDEDFDRMKGNVYQGYEQNKIYRREEDTSAYAGMDRIFAHLKNREREKVRQSRLAQEQRDANFDDDDLKAFLNFLSKDSLAAAAFEKKMAEVEQMKDMSQYNLPTELELMQGKMPKDAGFGSEAAENAKVFDMVKSMKTNPKK